MPLRLLCDENIPAGVISSLVESGFDVKKVKPKMADQEIAGVAKRERRTLLTFDSDFANIIAYPPNLYWGIVRIKIHPPYVGTIMSALNDLFVTFRSMNQLKGKLIILEPSKIYVWGGGEQ